MLQVEDVMKLGLYPLNEATEEVFQHIHSVRLMNLFNSLKDAKKAFADFNIPCKEAYLTTSGLTELILFDGQWTMMDFFPMGSVVDNVILKQWNHFKATNMADKKDNNYESIIKRIPVAYKKTLFELNIKEIPEQFKRGLLINIRVLSEYQFEDFDKNIFIPEMLKTKKNSEDILKLRKQHSMQLLTIYRGQTDSSTDLESALSWTLDLRMAKFFANRFDSDGIIYQANVHVDNVLAYSESEEEVIVQYDNLLNLIEI